MIVQQDKPVELTISTEKVCFIILKAREFDVKVPPVEPDPGSNPADDGERGVIEDYKDDATAQELTAAISALNEDEMVDLIALSWVGRDDYGRAEWGEARRLARETQRTHKASYLTGMPNLGDLLEEGMATLGHECDFSGNL